MANPTTNFGWVMPTSASLVTNLPADFNVFGQAVDTSMQYLLGGTTGQILSKTSGTNMAFTWIANDQGDITGVTAGTGITGGGTSGTVTVTNDMATTITTAGDLIKGTGSGTYNRLGIGSTGQVLTVASGAPSWATPASGGGMTLLSTTSLIGVSGVTLSGTLTSYKNLQVVVRNTAVASGGYYVGFRLNADTGANYAIGTGVFASTNSSVFDGAATSLVPQGNSIDGASTGLVFVFDIYDIQDTTSYTAVRYNTYEVGLGSGTARILNGAGAWKNTSAVTAISVQNIAGTNFTSGSVLLYGVS